LPPLDQRRTHLGVLRDQPVALSGKRKGDVVNIT
jgi:hypothetical protein